jgi:hypothetical protein
MRNIRLTEIIRSVFHIISNSEKYNNSNFPVSLFFLTFSSVVLIMGCINTEGTLELKGKVIDEKTKAEIPGRKIIVQGLVESNKKLVAIESGQFSADTTGYFSYSLKKIKDAYYYNFCLVGDSDYAYSEKRFGLVELTQNAQYLSFSLSKLLNLTIKIQKTSEIPFRDTLYLSWESDGVEYRNLYPYRIENYGITDNSFVSLPGIGLRWIGGNINSSVNARVFADKMTRIHWELVRNKRKREFTDTITCKRDLSHIIYFTY